MNSLQKNTFLIMLSFVFLNINAQETFILNYEDVDIKKVTQDIANFSKKTIILLHAMYITHTQISSTKT